MLLMLTFVDRFSNIFFLFHLFISVLYFFRNSLNCIFQIYKFSIDFKIFLLLILNFLYFIFLWSFFFLSTEFYFYETNEVACLICLRILHACSVSCIVPVNCFVKFVHKMLPTLYYLVTKLLLPIFLYSNSVKTWIFVHFILFCICSTHNTVLSTLEELIKSIVNVTMDVIKDLHYYLFQVMHI